MKKLRAVEVRSLVAARNLEPYVQLSLVFDDGTEEFLTQWTPVEAYQHVRGVLVAVEAANTEAFMLSFLTGPVGLPLEKMGMILNEFRGWRERRSPPERPQ